MRSTEPARGHGTLSVPSEEGSVWEQPEGHRILQDRHLIIGKSGPCAFCVVQMAHPRVVCRRDFSSAILEAGKAAAKEPASPEGHLVVSSHREMRKGKRAQD